MWNYTLKKTATIPGNHVIAYVQFSHDDGRIVEREFKLAYYNFSSMDDFNTLIQNEVTTLENFDILVEQLNGIAENT